MNRLLFSLLSRANVATPVADAQAYLDSRAEDNTKLGDITKLSYGNVTRKGNTWSVETARGVVRGSEPEVRAAILRAYW